MTAGLATVIILALAGVLGALIQRQISLTAQAAMKQADLAMAEEVRSRLTALSTETKLLSEHPGSKGLSAIPRDENQETMEGFLRDNLSLLNVDWLAFIDLDGRVMASTRPETVSRDQILKPDNISADAWANSLIPLSPPTLIALEPVYVGSDLKMHIAAGIDIGPKFLQKASVGIPAIFALIDDSGVISSSQPLSSIEERGDRLVALANGAVSTASVPEESGLRLVAFVNQDSAAEPLNPVLWALVVLAPMSIAAAAASAAFLSRRATAPLAELTQSVKVLEDGRWPQAFETGRKDEFGVLQASFNEMIASLKTSRERLEAMLETDPLTNVWNHRRFQEELATRMTQTSQSWGLILVDLDDFHGFNERYGAIQGDQQLQLVASLVKSSVPDDAIVGRLGGDTFAVLASADQAEFTVRRIQRAISEDSSSSACVGWAETNQGSFVPGMLCLAAEAALAEAKSAGRASNRKFSGFLIDGSHEEIREVFRSPSVAAVRALAEAVDAKDAYTRGHSQRVAEFARELAAANGCDQGFIDLVYMTGTLHDVGKIGVPDSVLRKPDRLTDEEFAQIKLHPELGEKIVRQIPPLRETLSGIRGHHERWDGRGYPDRLAGESISLLARILAVADCFDAMTSDRPYRKGLPVEIALAEIEKGAGSQFDPVLAEVFVKTFRQKAA